MTGDLVAGVPVVGDRKVTEGGLDLGTGETWARVDDRVELGRRTGARVGAVSRGADDTLGVGAERTLEAMRGAERTLGALRGAERGAERVRPELADGPRLVPRNEVAARQNASGQTVKTTTAQKKDLRLNVI